MGPEEIARLERATVASLAPRRVEERSGWILAMDSAPMGRARSAAPLSHDPPPDVSDAVLSDLAEAYVEAGLPPAFRLPDRPTFDVVRGRLEATGFAPGEPTTVMIADPARVAVCGGPGAAPEPILLEAPDAEWAAVFCGPGFDPEEGARRVAHLARSPGARFGAIREAGQTLAVGVLSRAGGLGGVHGMRGACRASFCRWRSAIPPAASTRRRDFRTSGDMSTGGRAFRDATEGSQDLGEELARAGSSSGRAGRQGPKGVSLMISRSGLDGSILRARSLQSAPCGHRPSGHRRRHPGHWPRRPCARSGSLAHSLRT